MKYANQGHVSLVYQGGKGEGPEGLRASLFCISGESGVPDAYFKLFNIFFTIIRSQNLL